MAGNTIIGHTEPRPVIEEAHVRTCDVIMAHSLLDDFVAISLALLIPDSKRISQTPHHSVGKAHAQEMIIISIFVVLSSAFIRILTLHIPPESKFIISSHDAEAAFNVRDPPDAGRGKVNRERNFNHQSIVCQRLYPIATVSLINSIQLQRLCHFHFLSSLDCHVICPAPAKAIHHDLPIQSS